MTVDEVLKELEGYGNEGTKKVLMKHGAREPFFGVKVQDLKKIQKKVKKDHELSLALYNTGNSDAMYLASLIADEKKISKSDLQDWANKAYWNMISEYAVPWIAAESQFGFELGMEWIDSKEENIAAAGWSTLASLASIKDDSELKVPAFSKLLDRVEKEVHLSQNRVGYTMNGFVIAIGSYIAELSDKAYAVAENIGKLTVNMGDTSCKVPLAKDYIKKVAEKGRIGKKRKQARC